MVLEAGRHHSGEMKCEQWGALLADKMDGVLAPEQEAEFAAHAATCMSCGLLLEEAQRGREWLKLLDGEAPQPPVELLSKILEKTGAAGQGMDHRIGTFASAHGQVLPGARRWAVDHSPFGARDARLLLTAAMAFFSVALTLSMLGVRFTSVHAAELKPEAVQANMTRSFYGTKKQVVSFYENLRFVYEVESRMRAMRHDSDAGESPKQPSGPSPAAAPSGKPRGHALAQPAREWHGSPVLAQLEVASPGMDGEERSGL